MRGFGECSNHVSSEYHGNALIFESMTAKLRVLLKGTFSSHACAALLDTHVDADATVHGSLVGVVQPTVP